MTIQPTIKPQELFSKISPDTLGGTIRDGSVDERFAFGSLCFNIEKARKISKGNANSKIEVSEDWSEGINVSPSHALRGDSDNPVFVALIPTEDGEMPLLIDGHHRMYRAIQDGEEEIDAYTFTPEEVMTLVQAPPDVIAEMESNMKVNKSQPGGSDVHVKTPMKKAPLTTDERNSLHDKTFALPKERKYPIQDLNHARNALARASGKPEEAKVRAAVYRKYPSLKQVEKTVPKVLEGGGLDGLDSGPNSMDGIYSMGQIVSGIDWELGDGGLSDVDDARLQALENLSDDPDFYRKKRLYAANLPEITAKDTEQQDDDPDLGVGINLDLGSGQCREPGYLGVDLYKYDHGTFVDDMELGLPYLDDESCENIRMSNVPEVDPKIMMSTVQRLLMPDGQFVYEGPSEIYNLPPYMKEIGKETIDKEGMEPWTRQKFTRMAMPDAATSNDAEPRIGIAQYDMLPADALLAMDATGYYNSDGTSSGRGNRVHGYASQGALLNKELPNYLGEDNTGAVSKKICPIFKADQWKKIIYCVVLAPDEADLQDDISTADEIEKTAHDYLINARVVGKAHSSRMDADVVESYIAPQDFNTDGQLGPQLVKKGSWCIGIKINDPKEWDKVLSGEYTGVSVGGVGSRIPISSSGPY